jgi:D-alanine--poly(phosphoribitol) ligase subunit 2
MSKRETELVAYIQTNLSSDPSKPTSPDEPLINSGLIDSMSIIEVLAFIEEEWQVFIPDQEATARQFDTVASILKLVDLFEE